jgi:hypothetical protein
MLDTNVFDKIIETPGMTALIRRRVEAGALTVLTPHVHEDELGDAPESKRARFAEIPRDCVPTSHFVLDHSRWDQARLGEDPSFEQIRRTHTHTRDGLIGATAKAESALVRGSCHSAAHLRRPQAVEEHAEPSPECLQVQWAEGPERAGLPTRINARRKAAIKWLRRYLDEKSSTLKNFAKAESGS